MERGQKCQFQQFDSPLMIPHCLRPEWQCREGQCRWNWKVWSSSIIFISKIFSTLLLLFLGSYIEKAWFGSYWASWQRTETNYEKHWACKSSHTLLLFDKTVALQDPWNVEIDIWTRLVRSIWSQKEKKNTSFAIIITHYWWSYWSSLGKKKFKVYGCELTGTENNS